MDTEDRGTDDLENRQAILRECRDAALHTFGTAWIFEQRARQLRNRLNLLNFLGMLGPVTAGGIALAYGADSRLLSVTIALAATSGACLSVVSVLSLVFGWVEAQAYANESLVANHRLSERYLDLVHRPPPTSVELYRQFDLLQLENRLREESDNRQGVTSAEDRAGLRAALRQMQQTCVGCNVTPTSMDPAECAICGNFGVVPLIGIVNRRKK